MAPQAQRAVVVVNAEFFASSFQLRQLRLGVSVRAWYDPAKRYVVVNDGTRDSALVGCAETSRGIELIEEKTQGQIVVMSSCVCSKFGESGQELDLERRVL